MKKVFISILSLCALVASAQDETTSESSAGGFMANSNKDLSFVSKNGFEVLPQAGDWGIGIAATGPLNYVGNFIGQGSPTTTNAFNGVDRSSGGNTTIFGKYFVNSHTAYRGWLSTENTRTSTSYATVDQGDPTNTAQPVYDKQVVKERGFMLGAGLEKRRGNGRLIGVYGAEAFLGFNQGTVTTNSYANELNATNPTATTGIAGATNAIAVDGVTYSRTLSNNASSALTVGVQGFLGVEYFVAPKLSLGGEFNLGLSYIPNFKTTTVVEYFNASNGAVEEFTRKVDNGDNETDFSTANAFGGSLKVNFYF